MISFQQIKKQFSRPELDEEEMLTISAMDKVVDDAITSQFKNSTDIYITKTNITKLLDKHGIHRAPIILNFFKNVCQSNGWNLITDDDNDELERSYFILNGIK